jgi:hypothetical protein
VTVNGLRAPVGTEVIALAGSLGRNNVQLFRKTLSMNDLHLRDYSPWEGWEIEGWPTTVMLRGKVMVDGGQLLGAPDDGQLVPRKIDPVVLRRPAF